MPRRLTDDRRIGTCLVHVNLQRDVNDAGVGFGQLRQQRYCVGGHRAEIDGLVGRRGGERRTCDAQRVTFARLALRNDHLEGLRRLVQDAAAAAVAAAALTHATVAHTEISRRLGTIANHAVVVKLHHHRRVCDVISR